MLNDQIDASMFSSRYFENYDGAGRSYNDHMKFGVTDPKHFHRHVSALGLDEPKSMLDLGAADGSALLYYKDIISSIETIHGVDISPYAHSRRKIEQVALGDVRDVLHQPTSWMLSKYDVILMAAAMYLQEAEFVDVISAIRRYCHEKTVILVVTPGQYYGNGLYEYWDMAELSLGKGANALIRPKLWWLQKLAESGLFIVGDVGGHGLLARSGNEGRIRPDLGSSVGIDAEFTFDRQDGRTAAFGEVWLHSQRTGHSIGFSYERGAGFHQIGKLDPEEQLRATAPALADILCYFRNGCLGSERKVRFLPFLRYVYVPGAVCHPGDDGYHVESDPNF